MVSRSRRCFRPAVTTTFCIVTTAFCFDKRSLTSFGILRHLKFFLFKPNVKILNSVEIIPKGLRKMRHCQVNPIFVHVYSSFNVLSIFIRQIILSS